MLETHPTAEEISTVIANRQKIVPGGLERWEQSPPDASHSACAAGSNADRSAMEPGVFLLWLSCAGKFSSIRSVLGH